MSRAPRWAWVPAATAPVALIGGWTLAARLQDGFDSRRETISALAGLGMPHRVVMTTGLALLGAAHLGTAAALSPARPAGRLVLATGGAATVLVAAYPLREGGGPPEHAVAAGVAFTALAVWPALAARRGGPLRPVPAAVATAGLLGLVGWFAAELSAGTDRVGLAERAAAGAQALWPLAAVALARRVEEP
ncbi:putative membrane protein [Motilibacter rhizosphaerae]|uniref:Putative membrane protein n=1 Tax=Motilibacter rhizosphaerae TaxID=598652 RepID=A0A4Q7NP68_9ACTN|nr:DUF998 domain-containing protein [Motilibacter rhizosphaerae]RZS87059.1 putative membrane protein [Motilibacter rhizosphaerae]